VAAARTASACSCEYGRLINPIIIDLLKRRFSDYTAIATLME
jgi:hypothetical protein